MTYQLVLQFYGDALEDYDAMIALEGELMAELGDKDNVDGHDVGSNQINIFILTANPVSTFQRARPVLKRRQQLDSVAAAYRETNGEKYIVIWPEGSLVEFKVA